MAHLLVLTGDEPGRRLPLHGDRIVLGRDDKCEIVITKSMVRSDAAARLTDSVSRRHAVVTCEGDKFFIEDGDGRGKKSRNGTYVNDQRLPFPGRVPLRNDDRIRICDFVCTFFDGPDSGFSVEAAIDKDSSHQSLQAQPAEKLRIILEISNSLSMALEIDALLPRIVEHLFQLFPQAERGFIILRDEATGELLPRVAKTRRAGDEPGARFSACIVRQCLANAQAVLGNDPAQQFPDSESISALPIRSLMCAPLWAPDGRPIGAVQLDLEGTSKKFTRDDLNLLVGVASQASIALSNARLYRDSLSHQRRARDLEVAHEVQQSLLPQELPDVPGYAFYAYYQPALEIGGDYYDFIPLPGRRLAVLLGDVAGKGVAAALVMVKFSVEARACLLTEPEPAAAVNKLNALMLRAALADRFVTLTAAVLDPAAHTATLVNAGHPSPLLARRATGAVEMAAPLEVSGPPVGVVEGQEYACCQVRLQPGDRLLLFSDGVNEALDVRGRQFGVEGVRAVLGEGSLSPKAIGERLIQAVKRHSTGCEQNDDVTLVCVGRAGA
jgi:serine phosphatase RsbU (regulator of sigma subunit)